MSQNYLPQDGSSADAIREYRLTGLGTVLFRKAGGKVPHEEATATLSRAIAMQQAALNVPDRPPGAPRILSLPPETPLSTLENDRVRVAWRVLRWLLMALGYGEVNEPLATMLTSPALLDLIRDQDTGMVDPYRPVPPEPLPKPSASGAPGIHVFRKRFSPANPMQPARAAARGPYPSLFPPAPQVIHIDHPTPQAEVPLDDPARATAEAWCLAVEALQMRSTPSGGSEPGVQGLVPADGPEGASGGALVVAWECCPDLEEILAFEAEFLTAAADVLSDSNQDVLRRWIRSTLCATEWEAFSIVQTTVYWSAALRVIEPEAERVLMLRSLEQLRERATRANDFAAILAANRQIASILGLNDSQPGLSREQQFRNFDKFAIRQAQNLELSAPEEVGLPLPSDRARTVPFEMAD